MKRLLPLILCFAMLFAVTACGGEKTLVGISMPTDDSSQRWLNEGELIKKGLEKSGYKVDLQYADNTYPTQMKQIEDMIKSGVKAIVITPADSNTLKTILETAAKAEIFVILHDRVIYETPYITAMSTFNSLHIGAWQAAYLIAALELETSGDSVFNMEIFSGPEEDISASQIYSGGMALLGSFVANGKLKIVSGQVDYPDTAISNWDRQSAYERMKNLLATYYTDKELHAVFAGNDELAAGIIDALDEAGKSYPIIITGEGAEPYAVKNILDGKQTVSIFKDPRLISNRTVTLVDQILSGKEVETNTTADNGSKRIPTYENELSIVDIVSYKEILIDSGYYKESDFK